MKIIDNFLEDNLFLEIQKDLQSENMPWFFKTEDVPGNRLNKNGFFNFYDNYISNLDIFQLGQFEDLNDRDSKTYGVRLRECYPSVIGDIQYDSGSQNQYVAIKTFYSNW